jgi:hypothetical protein
MSAENVLSDSNGPYVLSRQVLNKNNTPFDHSKFEALMVHTKNFDRINQINIDFHKSGKIISIKKSIHTDGFTTKIIFKTKSDYKEYVNRASAVCNDIESLSQEFKIVKRAYFA